ncbi:MAG TPA: kelch repeat-containing protein [Rudaea sp.]|nr:kelch repeat-containing protein [Rudaea sp.]
MSAKSWIHLLCASALAVSIPAHALPGTWTAAGDMAVARDEHTATLLPSGKVLVTGDFLGTATAELFDPATSTWSAAASLHTGRGAATASLLSTGQVFVAGGNPAKDCNVMETTTGSTTVCYATTGTELYTPGGNVWNTTATMATARQGHTATVLASGKVLVVGGASDCTTVLDPSSETFYCTYLATAELYDPAANSWSAAGTLTTARMDHTATLLASGKVLVAGGRGNSGVVANAELYDPVSNTWSSAGNLVAARVGHTATLLGSGKVYIAGGDNGNAIFASAELYDPAANASSAAASLTTAREDHTATLLPSGKVLIAAGDVGGSDGLIANPDIYDPSTNTTTRASSMITPRYGPTATLLKNGEVLITGGFGVDGELKSSELFDATSSTYTVTATAGAHGSISPDTQTVNSGGTVNVDVYPDYASSILNVSGDTCTVTHTSGTTWATNAIHANCAITASFLGPMSAARYEFTATLLSSGKVLLAGGSQNPTADVYDPVAKSLSPTGPMQSVRYAHSATLLPSGKVLVAGGNPLNGTTQLSTTEIYDPATNTWSAGGSMSKGRAEHAAALLSTGKVLVVGSMSGGPTGSAELYNPATNTWSAAAAPSYDRSGPTATALASGKVLLVGGYDTATQLYNPATNTWSTGGRLANIAGGQTATLLPSGKVLIAGGYDNQSSSVATVSIYDPTSNTWTVAASMSTPRVYHTASLLPNGKLLVLGGVDQIVYNQTYLDSGETYDPATNTWTLGANLSENRYGQTATPVSGGQTFVAGGDATGSVELYGNSLPDDIFRNGFETN